MSSVSESGGEQPVPPSDEPDVSLLHTSNSTSGFFLGRQPRSWEVSHVSTGRERPGALLASRLAKRPRTGHTLNHSAVTSSTIPTTSTNLPESSLIVSRSSSATALSQHDPSSIPRQDAATREDALPATQPHHADVNTSMSYRSPPAALYEVNTAPGSEIHTFASQPLYAASVNQSTTVVQRPSSNLSVRESYTHRCSSGSNIRADNPTTQISPDATNISTESPNYLPAIFPNTTTASTVYQPQIANVSAHRPQNHTNVMASSMTWNSRVHGHAIAAPNASHGMHTQPSVHSAARNQTGPSGLHAQIVPQVPIAQDLVQTFEKFVDTTNAARALNMIEWHHIECIREAIAQADTMFLLLHQISCAYVCSAEILISAMQITPQHIDGLHVLDLMWKRFQFIRTEMTSLFCNFPLPLRDTYAHFREPADKARDFLAGLPYRWNVLRLSASIKKCPPSAVEIHEILHTLYPTTAKLFFVHLLLHIHPRRSRDFYDRTLDLFHQSRKEFFFRLQNPDRGLKTQTLINDFTQQFARLAQQHQLHLTSLSASINQQPVQHTNELNPVAIEHTSPAGTQIPLASDFPIQQTSRPPNTSSAIVPTSLNSVSVGANATAAEISQPDMRPQFFPIQGQTAPVFANPNPTRSALHQSNFSESRLKTADGCRLNEACKMYAFTESLLDGPRLVNNDTMYESWSIPLSTELAGGRVEACAPAKTDAFSGKECVVRDGSVLIHLRCIELPVGLAIPDEAYFSSATTTWPQHIFVSVSGAHVDFRRRGQHGRDMPCDVTQLFEEGSNTIRLSYHVAAREAGKRYALGFEVVRIYNHARAFSVPSVINAPSSLDAMIKLLRQYSQDDDVVMINQHISIDIIDPISARIFERPVRGKSCSHRECFDLDSYLQSRVCRHKNGLVYPDEWRCPICKSDARPTSLVVDEFLLQVKEKLIKDGLQEVRAILVSEDGSWRPKQDVVGRSTDIQHELGDTFKDSGTTAVAASRLLGQNTTIVAPIISLDDD